MDNTSVIKTNSAESPGGNKTSGGISKALLTPCRRVGLSRTWKKNGSSPFISPLSSANSIIGRNANNITPVNELKKRRSTTVQDVDESEIKKNISDEGQLSEGLSSISCNTPETDLNRTPTRSLLTRKKTRCLRITKECQIEIEKLPQNISELIDKNDTFCSNGNLQDNSIKDNTQVSQLSKRIYKSKQKENSTERDSGVSSASTCKDYQNLRNANVAAQAKNQESNANKVIVKISPNKLSKECIIVLQKKMFKTDKTIDHNNITRQEKEVSSTANPSTSQPLPDSDSDDLPLFVLNKKYNKVSENKCTTTGQNTQKLRPDDTVDNKLDDDFVDNNASTVKRLKDKTTSTTEIQTNVKKRNKSTRTQVKSIPKTLSQSSKSFDDDDDDDDDFRLLNKKTILVKKTYNKIVQPTRAKSTGSITQNDIDELKARIESKKNLLLAKTMTNETQELRVLIKKWQIGCQTALMDLLELMKKKMPEQNMDNPKLLETLKIPPDLVGYDSENDCFNTPEDANIILSALKLN